MDGKIDFSREQRGLKLTCEEAFAAAFFKRPFELFVALGDELFDDDLGIREMTAEAGSGELGLCERERAAARADGNFPRKHYRAPLSLKAEIGGFSAKGGGGSGISAATCSLLASES